MSGPKDKNAKKEQPKDEYQVLEEGFAQSAQFKENRKKQFLKHYGPNSTIVSGEAISDNNGQRFNSNYTKEAADKFNSITLPVPDKLTDEMVAIIALGAAMDAKENKYKETLVDEKQNGTDDYKLHFTQTFHYMNIMDDSGVNGRLDRYSDNMSNSKQKAKEALEDFENGKPEKAQQYVNNVIQTMTSFAFKPSGLKIGPTGEPLRNETRNEMPRVILEMEKIPELKVSENLPQKHKEEFKIYAAQQEGVDNYIQGANKLISNPSPAGSDARKQEVFDLMFNSALGKMCEEAESMVFRKMDSEVDSIFNKYKKDVPGETFPTAGSFIDYYDLRYQRSTGEEKERVQPLTSQSGGIKWNIVADIMPKGLYSDPMVIASQPNGVDTLKAAYKDEIEKSPLFNELVNADSKNAVIDGVKKANKVNFGDFPEVKLDTKKFAENNPANKEYNDAIQKLENTLKDDIYNHRWPEYINDIMKGLDAQHKYSPFRHTDSPEMVALKAKTNDLQELLKQGKTPKDPEFKEGLLEAYKASKTYQAKLKAEKNIDINDKTWEPKSDMGKARYHASQTLEDLAKTYAMDLIENDLALDAQIEEEKAQAERLKEITADPLNKPGSGIGPDGTVNNANGMHANKMAQAIYDANKAASTQVLSVMGQNTKPIEEQNMALAPAVAKLIAIQTVGTAYERYLKQGGAPMGGLDENGKTVTEEQAFDMQVEQTAKEIQDRDDFKKMMTERDPLRPGKFMEDMTANNGIGAMMKLSEKTKELQKEAALKAADAADKSLEEMKLSNLTSNLTNEDIKNAQAAGHHPAPKPKVM